ncbi:MAG TPA: YaiI/YqxD family protein [Acidisoma sp.]|nr:YaiI/YqxD family protein [Acidisoma sp.]
MTILFIDGDACPVREEAYRVADRLSLKVFVVANGSLPLRPTGRPNVEMITVPEGPDVADDWIADHIGEGDVCITTDIPLASRCLEKGARALSPRGHHWTEDNIGTALAGRAVAEHLRSIGANTRGPESLTREDRSRFLAALDAAIVAARRRSTPRMIIPPGGF